MPINFAEKLWICTALGCYNQTLCRFYEKGEEDFITNRTLESLKKDGYPVGEPRYFCLYGSPGSECKNPEATKDPSPAEHSGASPK